MENMTEPSSSISFTSSSHLSNGSSHPISSFTATALESTIEIPSHLSNGSSHPVSSFTATAPESTSLEKHSLDRLSGNLEQLLVDSEFDYSDAEIVVEGIHIGVHRCILAVRSKFFQELFSKGSKPSRKDGKPKYYMKDLVPYGRVGYEALKIFLSYLYTGKLKPSPPEVSTCVDSRCAHDACRPAINFVVELMYVSAICQITELISLLQRRLLNFVDKALVEDVIPILQVASHCQVNQLVSHCVERVARSDLDRISLEKELPHAVEESIRLLRHKSQPSNENLIDVDPVHEKRIKRIYKALDTDDVKLVELLLTESNVTLDDAYALHYVVAYCDPKVVAEVLDLGLADVNLRNSRGYTVLHVAARRKEPSIIVSLLTKGACASEMTTDEQSPVGICRRLTRPKDYDAKTKQGQESNKDRICIDILEREIMRNPMSGEGSVSSPAMADDLHMKLINLENRVAFARLLFPTEAKVAMEIAHADATFEFAGISISKGSCSNLREVDLNETPIVQNMRLNKRKEALLKTVAMGRRYFPHCSQVLDKFMEDDLPDLFYLEKGTPDEQRIKRTRFMELKDDVKKAFNKDKAESRRSGLSPSSSSSSLKNGVNCMTTKK